MSPEAQMHHGPRTPGRERRLARDIEEPVRDYVRALAGEPAFKRSRDEIPLTATAQKLRKLARYVTRPPPTLNPA